MPRGRSRKDKLWVRILRAKYKCGDGAIPIVVRKNIESNAWRGIRRTWKHVLAGIKWHIGDGNSVNFWTDTWLGNDLLICDAHVTVSDERKVSSYVSGDGDWKWDELRSVLPTGVLMNLASTLPPHDDNENDMVVWKLNKNNLFSINSAYNSIGTCVAPPREDIWPLIWHWQGPQRVKTCVWLAAKGKLLTNLSRMKRGMTMSGACQLCSSEEESIIHVLRDCGVAQSVLKAMVSPIDWNSFMQGDTKAWITNNLRKKVMWRGLDWKSVFAVTVWSIWNNRNRVIFDSTDVNIDGVIRSICYQVRSIQSCNINLAKIHCQRVERNISWTFPDVDWVKCNTDGSCVDGGNRTACGGVFRDCSGRWVKGFTKYLGSGSVLASELWGILMGLSVAWEMGVQPLWIESDSMVAVNLIMGGCVITHPFYNIVNRIRNLHGRNWTVRLTHTHREGNRTADSIANFALSSASQLTILDTPPSFCTSFLQDDLTGVAMPRLVPV